MKKLLLTLVLILLASTSRADITSNLLVYWNLNETSGTAIGDTSGNNNNGTVSGTGGAWVSGKIGNALSFSGSTEARSNANLSAGTEITFAGWVKFNTLSPDGGWAQRVEEMYDGGDNYHVVYNYVSNNLAVSIPQATIVGTTGTQTGVWYHVGFTLSNSDSIIRLYVNGTEEGLVDFTGNPYIDPANELNIGNYQGGGKLNGYLDDIRYYNRVLSATDMTELYALGTPPATPTANITTQLVNGYWVNGVWK